MEIKVDDRIFGELDELKGACSDLKPGTPSTYELASDTNLPTAQMFVNEFNSIIKLMSGFKDSAFSDVCDTENAIRSFQKKDKEYATGIDLYYEHH